MKPNVENDDGLAVDAHVKRAGFLRGDIDFKGGERIRDGDAVTGYGCAGAAGLRDTMVVDYVCLDDLQVGKADDGVAA